jgi:hypothetical protein
MGITMEPINNIKEHRSDSFHEWGDEDCDWSGIYAAERFLYTWLKRLGRIGVHSKEKYGTIRASVYFWDGTLYSLIWPGRVWYGFLPKWLQPLLCRTRAPKWLRRRMYTWQTFIYREVYRAAFAKWPHLWLEIGHDCQHELLGLEAESFGWVTAGKEEEE